MCDNTEGIAEIEVIVEAVRFKNDDNGFAVVDVKAQKQSFCAVGQLPFISVGEQLRLRGEWTTHPEYGKQFRVESSRIIAPSTLDGMEKYLASGVFKGIGKATARTIIDRFGIAALDIIQFYPDRLTEISGIGPAKAKQISESYAEQRELREVMLFLQTYGISISFAHKIYREYGPETERVIRKNPYRLADNIDGIGFLTADRLAAKLGFDPSSPFRKAAGIKHALSLALADGHCFLPQSELLANAAKLLGADEEGTGDALADCLLKRELIRDEVDGEKIVYLPAVYRAESRSASMLAALASREMPLPCDNIDSEIQHALKRIEIELSPKQLEAVRRALTEPASVITGGPGTGKTTIINIILTVLKAADLEAELAAPTGRAAKRMTETTNHEAQTLHRLLEYGFEGGEEGFQRNEEYPLECDALIVDEMSMVDIRLFYRLLSALGPDTRLILVGDSDQLPSVGAGNVLKDILSSGAVVSVALDEIFRQDEGSMIVQNSHKINHGEPPVLNAAGGDFFIERKQRPEEIIDSVRELVCRRLPGYFGFDPLRGIQVLTPMRKGEAGLLALNISLQAALNPPSFGKAQHERSDRIFRAGDKVMQIRNNYNIEWVKPSPFEQGTGVFNGDLGIIEDIDIDAGRLTVVFDDDRVADYEFNMLDELEIAYCISVHKSQGSEFDCVVLVLPGGPPMLYSRNLLYTAVTRAKKLVMIVGKEEQLLRMVANNHIARRYSALSSRLAQNHAD